MKSTINVLIELLSAQLIRVIGRSMEPAISEGSWVLVFRAGFRRREPKRFDVVRLEDWHMKRIIGLPGEVIALRSGELFVDGEAVRDIFAYYPATVADNHEWWPRDDEYIVLGDNRMDSRDSRKLGPVKRTSFRGRVRS